MTSYDVFGVLKGVCERFGYSSFIVMRLPERTDLSLNDQVIITNWHPELIRAYDSMGLITASPIIAHMRKSTLPLSYDLEEVNVAREDDKAGDAVSLFKQYHMTSGVYVACSDRHGQRGAIGYSGCGPHIGEEELAELNYISLHIYERISNIGEITTVAEDVLTEREKECLAWTASGKTSAETAAILEISENTVNHYLSGAAAKLGTVNKAHTVAKAIRNGLLNV